MTQALGLGLLPFTFAGLVVASVLYSMPFVVQPLQQAFEAIDEAALEAAATLRAGPWGPLFPSSCRWRGRASDRRGARLRCAHGGRVRRRADDRRQHPGQTRVVSVQIYDHVEAMEYAAAHALSGAMLVFSFVVLLLLYAFNPVRRRG